jgi:hypothetical protein
VLGTAKLHFDAVCFSFFSILTYGESSVTLSSTKFLTPCRCFCFFFPPTQRSELPEIQFLSCVPKSCCGSFQNSHAHVPLHKRNYFRKWSCHVPLYKGNYIQCGHAMYQSTKGTIYKIAMPCSTPQRELFPKMDMPCTTPQS